MISLEWTFQMRFVIALALGLLIGLERQGIKGKRKLALGGIRTFPIISMLGFACAWLYQLGAVLMLPAGLISLTVLAAISYISKIRTDRYGATSEITALLTFVVGAMALLVDIWIAMAIGIINTILLSEKAGLENIVEKLDRSELTAVLKFLLVTLIILPVLPNKDFTEFELNPAKIWQIVILVSTIGFIGYLLSKFIGPKVGLWLSGLLGGIVSSTAVCIANGRLAKNNPLQAAPALQSSLVACSVMYLRILLLIFIINSSIAVTIWWKFGVMFLIGFTLSVINKKTVDDQTHANLEFQKLQNPFEILPSLMFAFLFVLVSIATKLIKMYAGIQGLLSLASIVGLSDIDPFILSIVHSTNFDVSLIAKAILISMMSNTIVKGIYFGYYTPLLRKRVFIRFGILALSHIPLLFLN